MIRRELLALPGRLVHLRHAGTGPPVVLLHPSPLSSTAMLPLIEQLADGYAVYAPDTPGYGLSEALTQPPVSAADYAPALAEVLDALRLERVVLYGSATGAQLALEFAKCFPHRVALLLLDNAAHFEAHEREAMLPRYFPELAPRADGSHLLTAWHLTRELFRFFPWYAEGTAQRMPRGLPAASVLHGCFLDTLRAGPDYARAYAAAFRNEDAARYQGLAVPTRVLRWAGSVLLPQIDALLAHPLPSVVTRVDAPAALAARYAAIRRCLDEAGSILPASVPARPAPRLREGRQLWPVGAAHLYIHVSQSGRERPWLRLHAPGASLQACAAADGTAPGLRLDLPGHGESDPAAAEIAALADPIAQLMRELGWLDAVIETPSLSLPIAEAVAAQLPAVDVAPAPPILPLALRAELDLKPERSGAHVLRAFALAREQALSEPWWSEAAQPICDETALRPAAVHARAFDLLRCAAQFEPLLRRCIDAAAKPD